MSFRSFMHLALEQAQLAAARGEVPVGAVLVSAAGEVLAAAGNETRERPDPTAHAEMLVLRAGAEALQQERLEGCSLWVTLEPCAMCAMAMAHARIARLYFGAEDPKSGGVVHGARVFDQAQTHHRPEVYSGIDEAAASELLRGFFAARR